VRAFLAIVPPPEVLEPLVPLLPDLKERWPQVGWIPPERWHFTVCFLGDVGDDAVAEIGRQVSVIAGESSPIAARIGQGGTFPGGRRPRVAWVGVDAPATLSDLAGRVAGAAKAAGVDADDRPYRPHITMGRVRKEPVPEPDALRALLGAAQGGAFTVDRLVLYRSHLGPTPRYEELAAWSLGSNL